jgi:4-hydroxybenzoate polyprenyltransferase
MERSAARGMNLSVLLKLGRVSNLPTVWTNVLAGTALAGGASSRVVLFLIVGMSLFYTAGMFLNDAFDYDFDRKFRPERPIPSGQIARREVFEWGGSMLLGGLLLVLFAAREGPPEAVVTAGAGALTLIGVIVIYDWRHKNNPVSPLLMGLCRVLIYLIAGLAVVNTIPLPLLAAALALLCYLIGLTYAAKLEMRSVMTFWPLAFLAVPLIYGATLAAHSLPVAVLFILFAAWMIRALSFLLIKSRRSIPRAVIGLIAGLCLWDAVLVASTGETALAMLCLAGLAATMGLQRWVSGT